MVHSTAVHCSKEGLGADWRRRRDHASRGSELAASLVLRQKSKKGVSRFAVHILRDRRLSLASELGKGRPGEPANMLLPGAESVTSQTADGEFSGIRTGAYFPPPSVDAPVDWSGEVDDIATRRRALTRSDATACWAFSGHGGGSRRPPRGAVYSPGRQTVRRPKWRAACGPSRR